MKMNNKGNDLFQTPENIYKQLDRIFSFTVDSACNKNNCLCELEGFYFDDGVDGLKESWKNHRVFCNPPFSNKKEWIYKAHKEVVNGCPVVVMILPTNCLDSFVWHDVIESRYQYEILKGRVSFIDPVTKKPKTGNNSGTVIVYFKNKIER